MAAREIEPGVLASFGRRVVGYLVDGIIIAVPTGLISAAFHSIVAVVLIGWVVNIVYVTTLLVRRGQTVGMAALGIRLQALGSDSPRISFPLALSRSVVAVLFTFPELVLPGGGLFAVVDLGWPLVDRERQTLHDKIVGTVVVRV
jgi:uncharacterized RDD family membrane protein YckC